MKGAVMAVVTESGTVRSGDAIHIVEPEASMHRPLRPI
jgi:MOSC domain-containing protein YiiM